MNNDNEKKGLDRFEDEDDQRNEPTFNALLLQYHRILPVQQQYVLVVLWWYTSTIPSKAAASITAMKKSSIPPLPSSKRPRSILGKENCIPALPNRKLQANSTASNIASTGTTAPIASTSCAGNSRSIPNASPSITTPMRSSRVLRYSETVDDFFCLNGPFNCTIEHRKLCEDIVEDRDGAASDLNKWKIVLEAANYYAGKLEKNSSEYASMGKSKSN